MLQTGFAITTPKYTSQLTIRFLKCPNPATDTAR